MITPFDFQPCPICHRPLGSERQIAGIDRATSVLLHVHRGDCYNKRQDLKRQYPGCYVIGDLEIAAASAESGCVR